MILRVSELDILYQVEGFFILIDIYYVHFNNSTKKSNIFLDSVFT